MAQKVVCRRCEVASYLEEESRMQWYGETDSIQALARAWHWRCSGCSCSCPKKRGLGERLLLFPVRMFRRDKHHDLPVQ